jgi:hypothetical protein
VGDLVNKMSNQSKDNIIHKDEIKYDKNKNLKIDMLFGKMKERKSLIDKTRNSEHGEEKEKIKTTTKISLNNLKDKEKSKKEIVMNSKREDDVSTQASFMDKKIGPGKRRSNTNNSDKKSKSIKKINPAEYNKNFLANFLHKNKENSKSGKKENV